jgi:biopolymer transport protein ExbD
VSSAPPAAPTTIPAIHVDLPRAGTGWRPPPLQPGAVDYVEETVVTFVVDIDAKGIISVDGGRRVVAADQLLELAREASARDPNVRAIIRADRATSWESVVTAMDRIKQGAIAKLAFAVEVRR